jgi:hypothetical protein
VVRLKGAGFQKKIFKQGHGDATDKHQVGNELKTVPTIVFSALGRDDKEDAAGGVQAQDGGIHKIRPGESKERCSKESKGKGQHPFAGSFHLYFFVYRL